MEQVEHGLAYYEQALSINPEHPWAAVKYYYHKYQLTRDESWKARLAEFVKAHPDDAHASHMLGRLGDPFIDFLPEPRDATLGILRQLVAEQVKPDSGINMGLSALESPSARMAVEMYTGHPMAVGVADIQSPDPRYPRREVRYLLWKYQGTDPIRAVDPPQQAAIDAVLSLFRQPYSLQGWTNLARPIAAQLGTDYLKDLLGVMVYPPEPENDAPIWMWIYRLQVAAALIIAQLNEPWRTSRRREALISIALGPLDWTIDAALVALLSVCLRTEEARADMIKVVRELIENPPLPGAVLYLGALVHCGLQLPDLPPDLRKKLESEK